MIRWLARGDGVQNRINLLAQNTQIDHHLGKLVAAERFGQSFPIVGFEPAQKIQGLANFAVKANDRRKIYFGNAVNFSGRECALHLKQYLLPSSYTARLSPALSSPLSAQSGQRSLLNTLSFCTFPSLL